MTIMCLRVRHVVVFEEDRAGVGLTRVFDECSVVQCCGESVVRTKLPPSTGMIRSLLCLKVMDARDMADLETGSFDAVIDKGLTDSVMYNDNFAVMMAKVRLVSIPYYQYACAECFTREKESIYSYENTHYTVYCTKLRYRRMPVSSANLPDVNGP